MMKNLFLLAALVASAMGAAIVYKEVGVHPFESQHVLGLDVMKQYGGAIQSALPWYGQHDKEYLVGGLSGPSYHHSDIDTIAHLAEQLGEHHQGGLYDTNAGYHTGEIGVIANADLNPMVHVVQQPFGTQWHGMGSQTGHIYVDDNGELLQGAVHHQLGGLPGVLVQGQFYPIHHQTGLYHIGGEGIDALKFHGNPVLTTPFAGQSLGDVDDLSTSILLQKLHPTQYTSGNLISQLVGQHGISEDFQQVPLGQIVVGHSGVVGEGQGKVWPSQITSGVHPWYWNVANHHF